MYAASVSAFLRHREIRKEDSMRKRYTTITCIFPQDPGKHYVYKTMLQGLKKGDLVVVECPNKAGFAIVGVWDQHEDERTRSQATKWAFQKIEVDELRRLKDDEATSRELDRKNKEEKARVHRLMAAIINDPYRRSEFINKMQEFLREEKMPKF